MGVVYEAVQEPLGRRVALKVLTTGPATHPTHLERFEREARTAARLHHGNIVPVFGVGSDGGTHYIAMQFIAGAALDEVIAEVRRLRAGEATTAANGSSAWLACPGGSYHHRAAGLAAQAADALAYAHRQGVLHRDIKPSNLLLDANGTLWVADFGLAKESGADDLTTTGDIVGTLRYLAPERLNGTADARSDVYSLAATLYELLTLHPAFDAADRATLIKQIADGHVVAPRRLDPAIPVDLETVVLKALAREPAARYASAGDLADDLRNMLADRPVHARRLSLLGRGLRWARRNPALATALSAIVLLAIIVASVSTIAATELAGKNVALSEANELARRELELSLQAIGSFHGRIAQDLLLKEKRFERLRGQLLDEAREFYRRLESVVEGRTDPDALAGIARAYHQLGELVERIRRPEEALSLYQKAATLRRHLAAVPNAPTQVQMDLCRSLLGLSSVYIVLKDRAAAVALGEAQAALELAIRRDAGADDCRSLLAQIHERLGYCRWYIEARVADARAEYAQAKAILDSLAVRRPTDVSLRDLRTSVSMNMATIEAAPLQQRALFLKLLVEVEARLQADPSSPERRYALAHVHMALAGIVDVQISPSVGLSHAQTATAISATLVQEYPGESNFDRVYAIASEYAARHHTLAGRRADARIALELACRRWEPLCADDRVGSAGRAALARSLTALGDLERASGQLDQAQACYDRATVLYEGILAATPTEWNWCNLAATIRRQGLTAWAAGLLAEAAAYSQRARDLIAPRIERLCFGPSFYFELASCHATIAGLAIMPGSGIGPSEAALEADRAMQALRTGLAFFRPPPALLANERGLDALRSRADFTEFTNALTELERDRVGPDPAAKTRSTPPEK